MDSGDDTIQWMKQLLVAEPLEIEKIVDKRVMKKTKDKAYLVKWKNHPVKVLAPRRDKDVRWMTPTDGPKTGAEFLNFGGHWAFPDF